MQPQAMQPTQVDTLKDKIKDIRIAILTTQEPDGDFHGRPMYTQEMDPDGSLWFFTHEDSNKVREVRRNNKVSLSYSDEASETYVATSCTAEVVKDRAKIDQLWSDMLKAYFPNGKDDPNIALLKINTHQAEYWDRPGGRMASLFQQVKGAITGQQDTGGRNEKLGDEPQ